MRFCNVDFQRFFICKNSLFSPFYLVYHSQLLAVCIVMPITSLRFFVWGFRKFDEPDSGEALYFSRRQSLKSFSHV